MLESTYEIGKFVLSKDGIDPEESIFIDPNVTHLIVLRLIGNAGGITGHEVLLVEYDVDRHLTRYPYRKPPSNGSGPVPTVRLNVTKTTLSNKVMEWFKKRVKSESETFPVSIFEFSFNYLKDNIEKISGDIDQKKKRLKSEDDPSFLITVEFKDTTINEGFQKYIRNNLIGGITEKFYKRGSVISRGEAECFYCMENKVVNGFASPYAFYTHDKITFSKDFDKSLTWRNFPVCDRCELIVEHGARYVVKNLTFNFYGVRYSVYPKMVINEEIGEYIEEIFEAHEDHEKTRRGRTREVSLSALTDDEKEILEDMASENNYATLTFLFYVKNNSQFEILRVINDVLPSRLSLLFDRKREIERNALFSKWWDNLEWRFSPPPFSFGYGFLREIYPKGYPNDGGKKDIYRAQFLSLVAASFKGDRVNPTSLILPITRIMQNLMANRNTEIKGGAFSRYSMENYFYHFALRSLILFEFYVAVGCIPSNNRSKENMNDIINNLKLENTQLTAEVLRIFEDSSYFDHPAKKACFITGILVHQVGQAQFKQLKAKPFYEKLDGMRLGPRKIKRIFTDAMGKLIEYKKDKFETRGLETLASHYFIQEGARLSNEDISFSFGLGLSYGNVVWRNYQKKNGENND